MIRVIDSVRRLSAAGAWRHPREIEGFTSKWLRALLLLSAGAACLVATFSHVVLADPAELSGRYDVYRYFGPLAFFMDSTIHQGEVPLWNPLAYCGMPFAGNPQPAFFYPPNLLRSLLNVHPTPYSTQAGMCVMMGLHILLAACGAYWLARSHKLGVPAAAAAAVAFAFSALMVRRVCAYHFVTVLGWFPLLLLLAKNMAGAVARRDKAKWSLLAGLVFGISTLGGFLQIVNYIALSVGSYVVLYSIFYPAPGRGSLARRIGVGTARNMVFVALVFVLGGLIAAAVLVPTAELAGFTARETGEGVSLYSNLFNKGPRGLLQDYLVYGGIKYQSEALRNSGIIALILAVAGLAYRRFRSVLLYLAVYLILLDCSFGPPMPVARLVSWLTPFSLSVYSRAYDVALLPLSLLAAFGVESLLALPRRRWIAVVRAVAIAALGGCAAWLLHGWLASNNYLGVSAAVVVLPAVACVVVLIGACGARLRWICVLLPALIFAETLAWNTHFVPRLIKKTFPEPAEQFADPAVFPQDNTRGTERRPNRELFSLSTTITGYDPLHLERVRSFISGPPRSRVYHRLVTEVESTADNERGNLLLKRLVWLAPTWTGAPTPGKDAVFPPTEVAFLSGTPEPALPKRRTPIPPRAVSQAARRVPVDAAGLLGVPIRGGARFTKMISFEIPGAVEGLPPGPAGAVHSALYLHYTSTCRGTATVRFYEEGGRQRVVWGRRLAIRASAGQEQVFEVPLPDYQRMRAMVAVKPAGRGSVAFTQAYVLSDQNDEDGCIASIERKANSTTIELRGLPGPRILIYLDADYPGWRAAIDGKPAPVFRAFDVFKAVAVPAGNHRVRFEFRPTSVYAGAAVSLIALVLAIAGILYLVFNPTPKSQPPNPTPPARDHTAAQPHTFLCTVLTGFFTLLVLAVLSRPLWLDGLVLHTDLEWYHLPLRDFYARCLAEGEAFTWLPELYCGYYVHGEGQAGMFHPVHFLLYRFLPLVTAFNIEFLLSYPFMFTGTYLFLRRWRLPVHAALFGAFGFAFSSFALLHDAHLNAVAVISHIPWVLWAAHGVMRPGEARLSPITSAAALAVLTASQLLLGFPQAVYFSLAAEALLLLCLATACLLQARGQRAHALRTLASAGLLIIAGNLFAVGLAAVQVLPSLDFVHSTERLQYTAERRGRYSLHPVNTLQFLSPYLFSSRVGISVDSPRNSHEAGLYNGALSLPLFLTLLFPRRRKKKTEAEGAQPAPNPPLSLAPLIAFSILLCVGGLWLALGRYGGLYGLVSGLPLLRSFRCPCRHIVLFQLGLALGGAAAWKRFVEGCQDRSGFPWRLFIPFLALAAAGGAAAALLLAARHGFGGLGEPKVMRAHLDHNPWVLLAALAPAFPCFLAGFALRGSRWFLAGLLIFGLASQAVFGIRHIWQIPEAPLEDFTTQTGNIPIKPGQRVYAARNNWMMFNGVGNAEGYIGPKLARKLFYNYRAMNVLRVAAVHWTCKARWPVRGKPPDWRPVARPMPYVRCAAQARRSENPRQDLHRTDIARVALLDREIDFPAAAPGTAALLERTPTHIRVRCETPAKQLLVIAENFDTGWRAAIGGRELPLLRAYGDFMACEVPAGACEVVLDFRPASFTRGKVLSGFSIIILGVIYIGYTFIKLMRNRRRPFPEKRAI